MSEGRIPDNAVAYGGAWRMQSPSIAEMFGNELLQAVLAVIQDGICLLSSDMKVLYSNNPMEAWFAEGETIIGRTCYEVFHGKKEPCEGCPVLKSMLTKHTESEERRYIREKKNAGWHRVYSAPILGPDNEIVMYIEYVREITDEKRNSLSVELMQNQVESLQSILSQKEEEHRQKEQTMRGNVQRSFDAVLKYLNRILDEDSYRGVQQQFELTMHGVGKENHSSVQLSGQELLIARYIADGYLSKEIADELSVSKKTVDYHRTNLRKKLKLEDGENLKLAVERFFRENDL